MPILYKVNVKDGLCERK